MEVVNGAGINDNPTRDSKQKIRARDKLGRNDKSRVGARVQTIKSESNANCCVSIAKLSGQGVTAPTTQQTQKAK